MSDVFISHSSKDAEIANKVCKFLEDKGLSCWIAPRNIVPGADWAASISTAITASKVFLIIYSANSAASTQVPREIGLAESKEGVYTIPYRVDDTPLTGSFEYYLTGAHWVNANYAKKDFKLDELYSVISGITGKNIQNITNNTYIDNLHIHNGEGVPQNLNEQITGAVSQVTQAQNKPAPAPAAPPAQPAEKKKLPIGLIAGIAGAVLVLGIIIVAALVISNSDDDDNNNNSSKLVKADTIDELAIDKKKSIDSDIELTTGKLDSVLISLQGLNATGSYTGGLNSSGQPDGKGTFNGSAINGQGETATVVFSGQFEDGIIIGQGKSTISFANGNIVNYEGDFLNGYSDGKGKASVDYVGQDIISAVVVGDFKVGLVDGKAIETQECSDGSTRIYDGYYKNDMWDGEATLTIIYQNGVLTKEVLEGQCIKNVFSGEGKHTEYFYDGSKNISVGNFEDGIMVSGKRTTYDLDGKIIGTTII